MLSAIFFRHVNALLHCWHSLVGRLDFLIVLGIDVTRLGFQLTLIVSQFFKPPRGENRIDFFCQWQCQRNT